MLKKTERSKFKRHQARFLIEKRRNLKAREVILQNKHFLSLQAFVGFLLNTLRNGEDDQRRQHLTIQIKLSITEIDRL